MSTLEQQIEEAFIEILLGLNYVYPEDNRDRDSLEKNFREKVQALNRVHLTDSEFAQLLDRIITSGPKDKYQFLLRIPAVATTATPAPATP